MYKTQLRLCLGLLALLGACAKTEGGTPSTPPPTDNEPDASEPEGECEDGETRDCPCAEDPGVERCRDGEFTGCICPVAGDGDGDGDGDEGVSNTCKAGYYVGSFEGEYWSGVFELVPGTGSLFPVTIKAMGDGTREGLALTIEEIEVAGGEFPIYEVGDGCVIGIAQALDGWGGDHPFVATMTGDLDCETGKFSGTLKGYYYLFGIPEIKYNFEGPVAANYIGASEELSDGRWNVVEHMMGASPPGGSGTWNAKWEAEEGPPLPPECEELITGEPQEPEADAGT